MANDIFLKIDGIPGESQDAAHKNEIEVISWEFKATQKGSSAIGGGSGAGKVKMDDFLFRMYTGRATPKLMEACATGKHIAEANFSVRKAGGQPFDYIRIKFKDLIISSYQTGGSGEIPVESCSFNFTYMHYDYWEQDAKGKFKHAGTIIYDQKKNKAG